jgi:hypothetical protein
MKGEVDGDPVGIEGQTSHCTHGDPAVGHGGSLSESSAVRQEGPCALDGPDVSRARDENAGDNCDRQNDQRDHASAHYSRWVYM